MATGWRARRYLIATEAGGGSRISATIEHLMDLGSGKKGHDSAYIKNLRILAVGFQISFLPIF